LTKRVREITGGQGVRAAIDAVGGQTGGAAASALARGGTLLVYGALAQQPLPIDAGTMIFLVSTVRGFWLSDWFQRAAPEKLREVSTELLRLMATGQVEPPVAAEYPLSEVVAAVKHAETPGRSGKVLLVG